MANGKFPQGFVLSANGKTIVSDDGRKLTLSGDENVTQDVSQAMKEFVMIRNFIDSGTVTDTTSSEETKTWKEIKSKETKNHLVTDFVAELAKEKGLSVEQEQKIVHQINFCVQLKSFSPEDIKLEKGKIESIEGLVITKKGEMKMPTIKSAKKSQSSKKKKNIVRLQIEKMVQTNVFRLRDMWGLEE